MTRTEAVIFDMDGVLVLTEDYHIESWRQLAGQLGIGFDEQIYDRRMRGLARLDSLKVLLEGTRHAQRLDTFAALGAQKDAIFRELVATRGLRAADGATQLLAGLRQCKVALAVASSSRNARWVLEMTGLLGQFDVVVEGSQGRSKPHPDLFLLAAEQLQIDPGACVVIEDAVDGVEAAGRAGMRVVAIGPADRLGHVAARRETLAEVTVEWLLIDSAALEIEHL